MPVSRWVDYTGEFWRDGEGTPFVWYHTENAGKKPATYLPNVLRTLREEPNKQPGAIPLSFRCALRVAGRLLAGKETPNKDDTDDEAEEDDGD